MINILDQIINERARYNKSYTLQEIVNDNIRTTYNLNIFFNTATQKEIKGNIPITIYKTDNKYIIMYFYFNSYRTPINFVYKEISVDDFKSIESYLN